jgi:ATP-dependent DNA helicase PIF1
LRLAYALTIHKAQGASLDSVFIDIGESTFEYGQAYVALSRVKNLDGLYLSSFDSTKIKIHKKVKKYYEDLKYEEMSEVTGTSVGALKASYHHAVKKIEDYILNQ